MQRSALLIVDVQNDFCFGGALAVPQGDEVVPLLNKYIHLFHKNHLALFASRDWHPAETKHFKTFGGLWPVHCVQNTKGAQYHPQLKLPRETIIISKGMDHGKDSYSVFQGFDHEGKSFLDVLKNFGINTIYVGGLATDYCVKFSVLDARSFGLDVYLLMDAIRGVNLNLEDSKQAVQEMLASGAKEITLAELEQKVHAS